MYFPSCVGMSVLGVRCSLRSGWFGEVLKPCRDSTSANSYDNYEKKVMFLKT